MCVCGCEVVDRLNGLDLRAVVEEERGGTGRELVWMLLVSGGWCCVMLFLKGPRGVCLSLMFRLGICDAALC